MKTLDKRLSIALEASAGTGKTFQLSMRVATMLMCGVLPQDILCLTFTNKATDEMLERVVKVLDSAASGRLSDSEKNALESALKYYAERIHREYTDDYFNEASIAARDRLLADFSSLKVKTLDAFFNQILKIFPFEAGLRPDFEICTDDYSADKLLEDAFYGAMNDILKKATWKTMLSKITDSLEISNTSFIDTLLIYASFSATRRIQLQNSLNINILTPEEIEALLDRAGEVKKEIINSANKFANEFDLDILNKNQLNIYNNIKNATRISDIIGLTIFIRELDNYKIFSKYSYTALQRQLHFQISLLLKEYFELKGNGAKALSLSLGRVLSHKLRELKTRLNLLTYADIGERAYEMLVTEKPHIDKDYLYFRLDGKINHILIDEFQDTSPLQWLILKPLAEETTAGVGQHDKDGSFFYVGDPKQNLYRFRGGSSSLFHKVANFFGEKISIDTLDVNFRSDKQIVELVNKVFTEAARYYNRQELNIFKIKQKPRPNCGEGYVEVEHYLETEEKDFAQYALRKVKEVHENGWDYGKIAVLVPANADGMEIKTLLAGESIPVRLETSQNLKDTGVFRAIMALAEFIETGNDFSFYEYAFTEINAFDTKRYADVSLRFAIMNSIRETADQAHGTIFSRLIHIIKDCGLQKRFEKEPNFVQTIDIISSVASDERNIVTFKEAVEKLAASKPSLTAEEQNAVTILTIHKSKGLQFPLVILPKVDIKFETSAKHSPFIMEEGDEPGIGTIEYVHTKKAAPFLSEKSVRALEEENALVVQDALNKLYVAMTRAEHCLIVGLTPPPKSNPDEITNVARLLDYLTEGKIRQGDLSPIKEEKKEKPFIDIFNGIKPYITEPKGELPVDETSNFSATMMGNLLHSCAFLLDGFTEENADKAFKKAMATYGGFVNQETITMVRKYLSLLMESTQWRMLFEGKVFRERKVGEGSGRYSIDFYSVFHDKAVLIDYKTGEISETQKIDYANQLDKYESILKKLYGLPVEKYIYHFNKDKLNIIKYN